MTLTAPYGVWANSVFGTIEASKSARLADPDGDLLTNLVEWAHGYDPNKANALDLPTMTSAVSTTSNFTYQRNTAASRVDEGTEPKAFRPRPSSNRVYRFPVDGSPA
ncbi:MAG: hypothetical protein ACKVHP_00310, partial [Verrucomicrobiales bacterium]